MSDEAAPAAPSGRRPTEGDVLGGRWRLGRRLASGPAGDLFAALSLATDQPATVGVLAPGADYQAARQRMSRAMRSDPAGPYLEIARELALGVTYVVLADIAEDEPAGSDRLRAMQALLASLQPPRIGSAEIVTASGEVMLGAADIASIVAGDELPAQPDPLDWMRERRLAAARTGYAPFSSVAAPPRRAGAVFAARSRAPPEPPPLPTASVGSGAPAVHAAPSSAGPRLALFGGAAAIGVLLLGSVAILALGKRHAPPPRASGERAMIGANMMAGAPATNAAPNTAVGAGAALQALAGSWTAQSGACDQPLQLAPRDGRLYARQPDGTTGEAEIAAVEGALVTARTSEGSVSYRVDGDSLTVTDSAGRSAVYARCPAPRGIKAPSALGGEAALIAMAAAGVGVAGPGPTPPIRDEVDVSAFAPQRLGAGETALVQVYLHLVDAAEVALERARAADPRASRRGQTTLALELARGARVDIMLDAAGLAVDEPIQPVVWRGRPCAAQFAVAAPADAAPGNHVLTARVLLDSVPLGRLAFSMTVAPAAEAASSEADLRGEAAKRYERAFLSYSSHDRPAVLKTAQTLSATGIDYFQDILSIEPGEAWRARLFAEIDRCDLFLLFWSSHAAASDWVRQEAEYALARRRAPGEDSPDIRPIILEGPPIPRPPPSLAELHFNDMLRYVVVASELEAKARADAGR